MLTIGVLSLQGDFKEHIASLEKHKVSVREVREKKDMKHLDGLIIPGGESTTIAKLLLSSGLDKSIIRASQDGLAIWGTCAGAILMAKNIESDVQLDTYLGILDIDIIRNAYGRQTESFSTCLDIQGESQEVFFIRAPLISRVGRGVQILVHYKGAPVLLKKKNIFVSTFHSEMTDANRVLEIFLQSLNGK